MSDVKITLDSATSEELIGILLNLINFKQEESWLRILRFVTGLLNTNNIANLKLASKLVQQILPDTPEKPSREFISALFTCLPSWTNHLPSNGIALIDEIWPSDEPMEDQWPIRFKVLQLTHKFLENYESAVDYARLYKLIEQQFSSEHKDEHSRGKFMMIKLLNICGLKVKKYNEFSKTDYNFLTEIINCLDLTPGKPPGESPRTADTVRLYNIRDFYINLLRQDNVLVLQWTVEYLLRNADVTKLEETNLLKTFLQATNHMELHNLENYYIPSELMRQFGPQSITFLTNFVQIDWKDVPLAHWLDNMDFGDVPILNQDLLLKVYTCISNIKNQKIRQWASLKILTLKQTIDGLSIKEFIALFEPLFQKSKDLEHEFFDYFCAKIRECNNFTEEILHLRSHWVDMIFEKFFDRPDVYTALLEQLKTIPKGDRGWWRLPPLFTLHRNRKVLDFYNKDYGIDMQLFENYSDLGQLQEKMECNSDEEKRFVHKRSIDVFVEVNLKKWLDIEVLGLDPLELLKSGTIYTFLHLTFLLSYHHEKLRNEEVFKTIIDMWKKDSRCRNLCATYNIFYYAKQSMNESEFEQLIRFIFNNFNDEHETIEQIVGCVKIPRDLLIQELLCGESATGDARIEMAYEVFLFGNSKLKRRDRLMFFAQFREKQELDAIIDELLRKKFAASDPILENSIEHLTQIRIARCLFHLSGNFYWTDQYWNALLALNNPLQISFIYECLIARTLPSDNHLIEKLRTLAELEPNQQDALVSTAYIYCKLSKKSNVESIVEVLATSTLKLAQLVVQRLKAKHNSGRITTPKLNVKDNVLGFQTQARLMLPDATANTNLVNLILHMTNAPYDEYVGPGLSKIPRTILEEYRAAFKSSAFA